ERSRRPPALRGRSRSGAARARDAARVRRRPACRTLDAGRLAAAARDVPAPDGSGEMSFAAPLLLLALVLVPLAAAGYVWIERQRDARAAEWATPALVPNLVKRPSRRTRHIPAALFL